MTCVIPLLFILLPCHETTGRINEGGDGNDIICGGPCPDLPSHPKGEW